MHQKKEVHYEVCRSVNNLLSDDIICIIHTNKPEEEIIQIIQDSYGPNVFLNRIVTTQESTTIWPWV